LGKVSTRGSWDILADRQTDRQTDMLVTTPHSATEARGGMIITALSWWATIMPDITRSHLEMVGDMSRVTLDFDLSKIHFAYF